MIRAALFFGGIAVSSAAFAAPRAGGFPQEYWGRWGGSHASCSAGAVHGGLTIARLSVRDGEFQGDVRKVVRKPNGSLDVTENWPEQDEGPTTFVSNYQLSQDRKSLTVRTTFGPDNEVEIQTLIRCGAMQ